MKRLEKYQIFEASKKNWLEITQNKLKEFKQMVDNNPVMQDWNNNDVMSELVTNLKDIAGGKFNVWYEESVYFKSGDDYISTLLTTNGEIRNEFWNNNPYYTYNKVTKWLDKKRVSGKEIETYYIVEIESDFNSRDYYNYRTKEYKEFLNSDKFTEWKEEIKNTKEFLKSLGFEVEVDEELNKLSADIKLQKTEEAKKKTLDLSDIVAPNIVDDFERFILKRGLTRADAEEIATIFNKKD